MHRINTQSPNQTTTLKEQFNQVFDNNQINRFMTRFINTKFDNTNSVSITVDPILELPKTEVLTISSQIQSQIDLFINQNFPQYQDKSQCFAVISEITQGNANFLAELLELKVNVQENIQFIKPILDALPPQTIAFYLQELIEIANNHIRLSVIHYFVTSTQINDKNFSNLHYLALNLSVELLPYIQINSPIFQLDYHKLIHLIKLLNADHIQAIQILNSAPNLGSNIETFKAFVSVLTTGVCLNSVQFKFIIKFFRKIQKPFTNKSLIYSLIEKEDYITLSYYMEFLEPFSEEQFIKFVSFHKSLNFYQRIKLEIQFLTNQISSITQIINV